MECGPTVKAVVVHVSVPLTGIPSHGRTPSSEIAISPPWPAAAGLTVAVYVTGSPVCPGFTDDVTVTVGVGRASAGAAPAKPTATTTATSAATNRATRAV